MLMRISKVYLLGLSGTVEVSVDTAVDLSFPNPS